MSRAEFSFIAKFLHKQDKEQLREEIAAAIMQFLNKPSDEKHKRVVGLTRVKKRKGSFCACTSNLPLCSCSQEATEGQETTR